MASGGMKLKAGEVVRIRVNPRDCLSALDVLDKANVNYKAMSFAQVVSLAFSSLLETARHHEMIPNPDGFEFLPRMQQFKTAISASHKKKVEITEALGGLGSRFQAPALEKEDTITLPEEVVTPEQMRSRRLLSELYQKKELAETNPNVVWQADDEKEFQRLYTIVYPHG